MNKHEFELLASSWKGEAARLTEMAEVTLSLVDSVKFRAIAKAFEECADSLSKIIEQNHDPREAT